MSAKILKKLTVFILTLLFKHVYGLSDHSDLALRQQEEGLLQNIHQITFTEMGFERAGEAYFSPDGRQIIFQGVPLGQTQYQIYIMNLEEGLPKMISTGRGACTCAYFHPDGTKVIFASSHDDPNLKDHSQNASKSGYKRSGGQYTWDFTPFMNIYQANLDGSELIALTHGENYQAECAYSSDGQRIVFASNARGSMHVYTMNADGSNVQQVTYGLNCYDGGPFFSPNGQQIIFRSDRTQPHYLQIFVINSDGTEERQLTANQAVNWCPYWHPNGKVVAFATSLHGHHQYEVYLMHLDSGLQQRVTYHSGFDGLPVFSLDGKKMMWTSKRSRDQSCQIFIADFSLPENMQ